MNRISNIIDGLNILVMSDITDIQAEHGILSVFVNDELSDIEIEVLIKKDWSEVEEGHWEIFM